MVLLGILLILEIIILSIVLVFYIVSSIGIMLLSKKMNLHFPWLAWVPLSKNYLVLKIGNKNRNMIFIYGAMWLFGLMCILSVDKTINIIIFIIAFMVFYIWTNIYTSLIYYKLSQRFNIDKELAITLSLLMPCRSILLFKMYNSREIANTNYNYVEE